ncbi:MAG: hypothetical protein ABIK96_11135 [bacterium]
MPHNSTDTRRTFGPAFTGTIAYFKQMAEETGIPYQTLINLYLRDCAQSGRRLDMAWKQGGKSR